MSVDARTELFFLTISKPPKPHTVLKKITHFAF